MQDDLGAELVKALGDDKALFCNVDVASEGLQPKTEDKK